MAMTPKDEENSDSISLQICWTPDLRDVITAFSEVEGEGAAVFWNQLSSKCSEPP